MFEILIKKYKMLFVIMLFSFVLVGCVVTPNYQVTSITLSSNKSHIDIGGSVEIKATINPTECSDALLTWTSSNESVATVDNNGKVIGIKEGHTKIKAKALNGVEGTIIIQVIHGCVLPIYPDLAGYEITLAHSVSDLGSIDPYMDTYTKSDKQARIEAWEYIEEMFNCKIKVEAYPESAAWGPSRWNHIQRDVDFDFYTIPDSKIPELVFAEKILPLNDWYFKYGNDMMNDVYIQSGTYQGELYSLSEKDASINNAMYYNYNLWVELNKIDPSLKEPAQMFLDGEWTYSNFVEYAVKAQLAMYNLKGDIAAYNSPNQEYFAMSGWDTYWWTGMSLTSGEALIDVKEYRVLFDTSTKENAASTLKHLYELGVVDKRNSVDGAVVSWREGKSLFTTGETWFVRNQFRWTEDQWGQGETKYGYVPFPMPDDTELKDYKVALGGDSETLVMSANKDRSGYGDDCTAENIYWVVTMMMQLTKQYNEETDGYSQETEINKYVEKYTDSVASREALKYINTLISEGSSFYDPLANSDSSLVSLYASGEGTITYSIRNYIRGNLTWEEAVLLMLPNSKDKLREVFLY